jgi:serine O-acetyltransferase
MEAGFVDNPVPLDGSSTVPEDGREPALGTLLREDWATNRRHWAQPAVQALTVYRIGHWAEADPGPIGYFLRPTCRLLAAVIRRSFDIDLSPAANIGRRLEIGHQGGIIVGPGVTIGDDCVMLQGNRIGCFDRHPVSDGAGSCETRIGDRVIFGAGATVDGPVSVADDARVGPNAVVRRDVESGAVAMAPSSRMDRAPSRRD